MKMNKLKKWLSGFLQDEKGASAIEYALMALMVAVALIALVPQITTAVQGIFTQIITALGG